MNDITDYYIGSRIKALRAVRGLSAEEVSEALDITRAYLSLIENGKKKPSPKIVRRAAAFFEVSDYEFTCAPVLFKVLDSVIKSFPEEDVVQAFELVRMKRDKNGRDSS